MNLHVVPFYAALLALIFVVLSVRTLRMRHRLRVPVGDGGDEVLLRATRVHANFAEYVPITLLLLAMVELKGASATQLHVLCAALLVGRISHAIGVSRPNENYRYRVAGMALTFAALIGAAASLLVSNLTRGGA